MLLIRNDVPTKELRVLMHFRSQIAKREEILLRKELHGHFHRETNNVTQQKKTFWRWISAADFQKKIEHLNMAV